jgi:hypothetical protein
MLQMLMDLAETGCFAGKHILGDLRVCHELFKISLCGRQLVRFDPVFGLALAQELKGFFHGLSGDSRAPSVHSFSLRYSAVITPRI